MRKKRSCTAGMGTERDIKGYAGNYKTDVHFLSERADGALIPDRGTSRRCFKRRTEFDDGGDGCGTCNS